MDQYLDMPLLGFFFRIRKIRQQLARIRREIAMSKEELQNYQLAKLKQVMASAYQRVPLYRDKWNAAGVRPDDLRTLNDLEKFPIVTKEEFRNLDLDKLITGGKNGKDYHLFRTTGSSGIPVSMLYDRDKGFYEIAEISTFSINMHFNLNLKKGMSILLLDEDAMEILPMMEFPHVRKMLFDALDTVENHIRQINRIRPDYLVTYPSVLKNIALKAQAEGILVHQPRLLFTTGESHDDHTRKIIRDVFKGEVLDGYASTETGIMAVECPMHSGLHVIDYKILMEIVDDRHCLVPPGRSGNVIVTDLNNLMLPVIRYAGLGDISAYRPEPCTCPRKALPLLSRVEGRKMDAFILPGNKVLHPFHLTTLMLDVADIRKFQIRQEKKDEIRVLIVRQPVRDKVSGDHEYAKLKERFHALVGSDVSVRFEFVDDICRDESSHKIPTVVSLVRQ